MKRKLPSSALSLTGPDETFQRVAIECSATYNDTNSDGDAVSNTCYFVAFDAGDFAVTRPLSPDPGPGCRQNGQDLDRCPEPG